MLRPPPRSTRTCTLFPFPTLFRSCSTTCGTGTRTVSFQCQNMADFDTSAGDFGAPEPDGQCIGAIGAKPAGSTSACTVFSGCTFDWVKPSEVVTPIRSEEHTSELQSLMRISYAVFCLKKKTEPKTSITTIHHNTQD